MLTSLSKKLPEIYKRLNSSPVDLAYGTSGFRTKAEDLKFVCYCVGFFSCLRSMKLDSNYIGVVITASHNPPGDNGVKIVDPNGGMLEMEWEGYMTKLVNSKSPEELSASLQEVITLEKIDTKSPARILIARDTRKSSPELLGYMIEGIKDVGGEYKDFGLQTTPFLHYMVMASNCPNIYDPPLVPEGSHYYAQVLKAYNIITNPEKSGRLTIDCANGVGSISLSEISKSPLKGSLNINGFNTDIANTDMLNGNCGADYVKTTLKPPMNIPSDNENRFCSLDGDADRVVFWYLDKGELRLIDGDKIATLFAEFLLSTINDSKLGSFKIGVVQTAYSNSETTNYIKDVIKVPISIASTGVKNLHLAAKKFDVGIYFEPNGHGSVYFSENFRDALFKAVELNNNKAVNAVKAFYDMINQATGDAIYDALAVNAILSYMDLSLKDWYSRCKDLPNLLIKVIVKDKNIFKTACSDTIVVKPEGIQDGINQICSPIKKGRAVVRASGTENVVRIYVEAEDSTKLEGMANKIKELIVNARA